MSDKFGRLFNLRVSNQNTVLINLPKLLQEDEELELTVTYAGRLTPQTPDRETLSLAQDDFGPANRCLPRRPDDAKGRAEFPVQQSQLLVSAVDGERLRHREDHPHGSGFVCLRGVWRSDRRARAAAGRGPLEGRRVFSRSIRTVPHAISFIVSRFVRVDRSSVPLPQSQPTSTETPALPRRMTSSSRYRPIRGRPVRVVSWSNAPPTSCAL